MDKDEVDELEYSVTFPTAGVQLFEGSQGRGREPVVLLFGWAGCQDRHLAKYSQLYNQLGCISIRYVAPPEYFFHTPFELLNVADRLIDLLTDLSLEEHQLVTHTFSNGGAMVYRYLTERLTQRGLRWNIRGATFDSGPIKPVVLRTLPIVLHCIKGSVWYRWLVAVYCMLRMSFLTLCVGVFGLKRMHDHVPHPWVLSYSRSCWPEFYLYSSTDQITPYQDVEDFMSCRRLEGILVTSHMFPDSDHVQHLRTYPQRYRTAVHDWLRTVCQPPGAAVPEESVLRHRYTSQMSSAHN